MGSGLFHFALLCGALYSTCSAYQQIGKVDDFPAQHYHYYDVPDTVFATFPDRNYPLVAQCIENEVLKKVPYDGGNITPKLLRYGFHVGGMYYKPLGIGGCSQAPARFTRGYFTNVESFVSAWQILMRCKERFPWTSYSDLWTLAAAVSSKYVGGPAIPWRPGRVDNFTDVAVDEVDLIKAPLPSDTPQALYDYFVHSLGLEAWEIAAVMGGHSIGRAHGVEFPFVFGVWTSKPFNLTNLYYQELLDLNWQLKQWDGGLQYEDVQSQQYMMFHVDLLHRVPELLPHVHTYAANEVQFFEDFASIYGRLLEFGAIWEDNVEELWALQQPSPLYAPFETKVIES